VIFCPTVGADLVKWRRLSPHWTQIFLRTRYNNIGSQRTPLTVRALGRQLNGGRNTCLRVR
jgi:hypothetical protein